MHSFSVCDFFLQVFDNFSALYCASILKILVKYALTRSHDQVVTPLSMKMFRELEKNSIRKGHLRSVMDGDRTLCYY